MSVLILVLMEDALRVETFNFEKTERYRVLILVLMEDALRVSSNISEQVAALCLNPCSNGRCSARVFYPDGSVIQYSLNPCSNGRCSASLYDLWFWICYRCLNPCSNGRCSARVVIWRIAGISLEVLILVLMEDALRELILRYTDYQLVTALFSENPLDFREKSVPNCPQIYEFPRSPHEATHYTE